MPPQHTRRALIQAIGGVSFTGLAGSATATSATTDEAATVAASELVIPAEAVPAGFERYSAGESDWKSAPFIEKLQSHDQRFRSVDHDRRFNSVEAATSGFWKGGEASNPQWVLSSMALVSEDRLPRPHFEAAAAVFYKDYIDEYDAETSVMIEFEKSYSANADGSDWQVDILEAPLLTESDTEPTPIFVERLHQQFLGNVYLGTVAFGPANDSPTVESRVEQFATIQRDRYDAARDTQ